MGLFIKKTKDKKKIQDKVKAKQFRYNKARTGHPTYIVEVNGDTVTVLGLSEKEKTHKQKNIKLDKNPEPNNNNDSYIRPHTEVLQFTDKTFSKNLKGWAFGESDKPKVKSVIEKDNKKRHSRNGKSSKRDRP